MSWLTDAQRTGVGVLPPDAERVLMDAARRAKDLPVGSPVRRRVIDRAYDLTTRMYPTMFKD